MASLLSLIWSLCCFSNGVSLLGCTRLPACCTQLPAGVVLALQEANARRTRELDGRQEALTKERAKLDSQQEQLKQRKAEATAHVRTGDAGALVWIPVGLGAWPACEGTSGSCSWGVAKVLGTNVLVPATGIVRPGEGSLEPWSLFL